MTAPEKKRPAPRPCDHRGSSGSILIRSLTAQRNFCLQPQVALCGLDRDVSKQNLDLIQFAAGQVSGRASRKCDEGRGEQVSLSPPARRPAGQSPTALWASSQFPGPDRLYQVVHDLIRASLGRARRRPSRLLVLGTLCRGAWGARLEEVVESRWRAHTGFEPRSMHQAGLKNLRFRD